jgi:hypothetical protein
MNGSSGHATTGRGRSPWASSRGTLPRLRTPSGPRTTSRQEARKVRRDGTVSHRNTGNRVPAEYIGDHVWLHLVDSKVVITHAGKTIAEHPLTV